MKVLFFMICTLVLATPVADISEIRQQYTQAVDDEEITKELYDELTTVGHKDNKTLVAYKGAVSTLMAKYAQGVKDKKEFFKKGAKLIEHAVKTEPDNIEIRCIRLGVQENSPKIVGYKDDIPEDKQFILENYQSTSSEAIKTFIKSYVIESSLFDESEKQLF